MTRARRIGLCVVVMLIAVVVLGDLVLVNPTTDDVSAQGPADAVVALAGIPRSVGTAQALVEKGVAHELVVSNAYGPHDAQMNALCATRPAGYRITCFVPDPDTTRGEARGLSRLARERGWADVVVVTSTFHVSRARLIVGRCYTGRLRMVQSDERSGVLAWGYQLVYQTGGFLKAAVLRGC